MEGVMEFLEAAGFSQQLLPFQDREEPFLVLSETALQDLENLQVIFISQHLFFCKSYYYKGVLRFEFAICVKYKIMQDA